MRVIKTHCPEIPTGTVPYPDSTSQTYTIKVITPLFGGGVEAGVNDPVTLIRPSSIRGHLRFWWRATRGANYASVKELRQREGEIWGTTENPSPVIIELTQPSSPPATRRPGDPQRYGFRRYGPEAYVLFPAEKDICREDFTFSLTLRWLKQEHLQELRRQENERRRKVKQPPLSETIEDITLDIEAAVWAWVNFGGIGARTRRGCGALYCNKLAPPSADDIEDWFKKALAKFRLPKTPLCLHWPTLGTVPLILNKLESSLHAWHSAVDLMREFRQGEVGRNLSKSPPSRSFWPEADSLRAITGKGKSAHRHSITLTRPVIPAFPRAELGLPIVFHFKDHDDEPNNCVLYAYDNKKGDKEEGKRIERMASPIVLRPLAVGNGTQAVAMVVPLTTLLPSTLELAGIDHSPPLRATNIRRRDLATYPKSPLGPPSPGRPSRSFQGSALEAFLSYAREKNFK